MFELIEVFHLVSGFLLAGFLAFAITVRLIWLAAYLGDEMTINEVVRVCLPLAVIYGVTYVLLAYL